MAQQLRILHCFRSPVGGIFRHVRDLTQAQVAAGHQVGIVCDSTTGGAHEARLFAEIEPQLALGIHRTPIQRNIGLGDIAAAWRTYKIIKQLQPDVLHGHGAKGGVYARMFGSLLRVSRSRVARLYSPHGGSLHYDEQTMFGRTVFAIERLMERFTTDQLLFVSEHEMRAFVSKVGQPKAPYRLVYNGLRAEEFEPVSPNTDAADFLYIGMMRDLKGPDIFIDALAKAENALSRPLKAVMVGDGDDLPHYKAQAAGLGLADRITFHPAMPARQAFALGRVIVVPSRAEAMPYIVLEALAAGMPMIATKVGGIPEILGPSSPALIRPGSADALAERMVEAIDDPQGLHNAMPSPEALQTRFGADVMAREIEKAYFDALAR
ncbi:glycosyltransferase family 4 protein [Tianweitania sp. BSSL-BM11]|uniref:Glycosyltransferase family 4 protein n=1 Tax=Tianweitania aestuarii TaxID=2814886 RepID=A0ABS5RWR0_9HYPH|nr:glycosyltransferase family 4 protein [Tianweitania aestuarii]MBS9720117.1 glycosyltransferase family 4 protein [Tianweitania aestuarii]